MVSAFNAAGHARVKRFLARACTRPALPCVVLGAGFLLAVLILGRGIEHHLTAVQVWIATFGPWSIVLFCGLFVVTTSMLIPESLPVIIAGAIFGIPRGLGVVLAGTLIASTLQFMLARHLLRRRVRRFLNKKPELAAIQRAVVRDAFRLQVLLRLTPLNPAMVSYMLGAAGISFLSFLPACIALVPNVLIELYFGYAGTRLVQAVDAGSSHLHDGILVGSLLVLALVVWRISRMARRAVSEAVKKADESTPIDPKTGGDAMLQNGNGRQPE